MTTTKTTRRPKAPQAPISKQVPTKRPVWLYALAAAAIIAGGTAYAVLGQTSGGAGTVAAAAGLPAASDYHSLLVSDSNPGTILLGTHQGLFRSTDGGSHWANFRLAGQDAMNLVRVGARQTAWLAGHDVFASSTDGGRSWRQLTPASLPSLDLHGFAVDPRRPDRLYAAVAGFGLYRSDDAGATFRVVSREVGGGVMALAVAPDGRLFADDMGRGLLVSGDGGRSWRQVLKAQLAGLAINPAKPQTILATGPGILRSTDGGKNWTQVLRLDAGAGPVAWSRSNPSIAYVVGFDRTLYRTSNAGRSWTKVGGSK